MSPPRALLLTIVLAGCEHTAPFQPVPPEPVGPAAQLPARLTFNPREDSDPTVVGDTVIFSRLEPGRADLDRCLAFLPAGGGSLFRTACPGGATADGTLEAWLQPAVGPDGRLAYLRELGNALRVSPSFRALAVAEIDALEQRVVEWNVGFPVAGQWGTDVRLLRWADAGRLRFIVGRDSLPSVDGVRDTLFNPIAIAELDLATGQVTTLPGTVGVLSYWSQVGGDIWFVRADDPTAVRRMTVGSDTSEVVGAFPQPVRHLAVVSGQPVASYLELGTLLPDGTRGEPRWVVRVLDVTTGTLSAALSFDLQPLSLVPVPGTRRLVLEFRTDGAGELWLFELP